MHYLFTSTRLIVCYTVCLFYYAFLCMNNICTNKAFLLRPGIHKLVRNLGSYLKILCAIMMTASKCSTEEAQILGPTLQRNLYAPDLGINYKSIRCHYRVKPAIMLIVLGACLPACDVYQVK
jgi:hypothetical protein